jgi:hypothetical protein
MSRRPVYRPPAKPPAEPRVRKVYQAHLSVTCYLDVKVWAADESEARLTAHDMTCPGKPTVATRMISESGVLLCTECAGNGFRLGTDWNVDTVEEVEKLRPHVPAADASAASWCSVPTACRHSGILLNRKSITDPRGPQTGNTRPQRQPARDRHLGASLTLAARRQSHRTERIWIPPRLTA